MEQIHFNYRDISRTIRYGFSFRRIGIHFIGILLGYLIYEFLVYLTVFITDINGVKAFWDSHGLLPVLPLSGIQSNSIITVSMWIGILAFGSIFFLFSTSASKITIEQLRGDVFFSVGNALDNLRQNWLTVFGAFFGLLFIIFFLFIMPYSVMFIGKIPFIGKSILVFSSIFTPFAFFLGLLIAFTITVFIVSLFYVPAIVATTESDAFETIYQLFAIVWGQPWRLIGYGMILLLLKLILVPIFTLYLLAGFAIVLLPMYFLHTTFIQNTIVIVDKWFGGLIKYLVEMFVNDNSLVFGINNSELSTMTFSTTICAIFITLTLLFIAGGVVAYLFSLASVGTTLIYIIVRKHIDGHNLLETIGNVGNMESIPLLIGDE